MAISDVLLVSSSSIDLVDLRYTVAEEVACLCYAAVVDLVDEFGSPELAKILVKMGRCRRLSISVDLVATCREVVPSVEADSSLQGCLKVSKTNRTYNRQDPVQSADFDAQVAGTSPAACHI